MAFEHFHTLEEIITNFAVVIAFSFVTSQVIFKKGLLGEILILPDKLKIGFLGGLLGILLMVFTVSFDNTILDFRQLAIILSALAGGGVAGTLLTGLIISLMRLFAFGSITTATVIAAVTTIVVSLGISIICSKNFSYWQKWLYSLLISSLTNGKGSHGRLFNWIEQSPYV